MSVRPLSEVLSRDTLRGLIVAGDVVDNDDPERMLRVRVRVPLVHREINDGDLPWARPLMTFAAVGMSGQAGAIKVPQIGSKVAVQFLDDSLYNALYIGDIGDATTIPEELLSDYPNAYGWIDPSGNLFFVNTVSNTVKFVHVSGSALEIIENGKITITSAAEVVVSGQSNVSVLAANQVKVYGGDLVDIRAARIDLNKSTSGDAPTAVTPRTRPTSRAVTGKKNL